MGHSADAKTGIAQDEQNTTDPRLVRLMVSIAAPDEHDHSSLTPEAFMRGSTARLLVLLLFAMALSGCAVVGGIFKTGFAVGIFVAVVIVILLFIVFGRR